MAEKLLDREQVDAVVEFANALYAYDQYGFWTPQLSNRYLQSLNGGNKAYTSTSIRKALSDYKNNEDNIQAYMEYANFFDMLFARTVQSYVNALAFDLQVVCTNAFTEADFSSNEYIRDKKIVNDFLNKFNYRNEFIKVVKQVMLHEIYYTWFRKVKWGNKGMKYALQILPQDHCLLTGYWEKGLLFDFDMGYFLQAGTDINGYDPAFKKYYQRVFGDSPYFQNYRPTNPLKERDGTYAFWTQTSPTDGAWAFKFNMSDFNAVPYLAPFLKNAIENDEAEQLQQDKDIAGAFGILAGEIATFDTAKSGTKADQMVFNPKTLGAFMAKAKAGLSKGTTLAALPLEDLKYYQYTDNNSDMYDTQLVTSAATGSSLSRIIYSNDRMSNAEIEGAMNEVYQTMRPLYYQFNNFLDFFVNSMTKKYKFRFIFDGATYRYEREQRMNNLTKLADKGIVLNPSAYASALGYEPQVFEMSLIESKNSGWVNNLQLLLNTNTNSDNVGGRPKSENPDDSTERNYDQ